MLRPRPSWRLSLARETSCKNSAASPILLYTPAKQVFSEVALLESEQARTSEQLLCPLCG